LTHLLGSVASDEIMDNGDKELLSEVFSGMITEDVGKVAEKAEEACLSENAEERLAGKQTLLNLMEGKDENGHQLYDGRTLYGKREEDLEIAKLVAEDYPDMQDLVKAIEDKRATLRIDPQKKENISIRKLMESKLTPEEKQKMGVLLGNKGLDKRKQNLPNNGLPKGPAVS